MSSSGPIIPLDYQRPPKDGRRFLFSLQTAGLFLLLLFVLLHALFLNTVPGSPLRQVEAGTWPQTQRESDLTAAARTFVEAADGGDVALHLEGYSADYPLLGQIASEFYFRPQYELYPHSVIVGRGDQIINTQTQLLAADTLPDDQWLLQHGVNGIVTVRPASDGVPATLVRRLR